MGLHDNTPIKTAVFVTGQGIFIQGEGTTRGTLTSTHDGINKEAKMTVENPFLRIELTNATTKKKTVVLSPLSNFSHLVPE